MTRLQKLIIAFAVLLFVAIFLHPPWIEHYNAETGGYGIRERGYHPLWREPAASPDSREVRVWSSRRSLLIFAVGGTAFVLYVLAGRSARRKGPPAPESDPDPSG